MRRTCVRCVMDDSDPGVTFDASGVCSVCRAYDAARAARGYAPGRSEAALEALLARIRAEGKGRPYDAVIGLSGGVDSAYLAHVSRDWGLRLLFVHVDTGMNDPVAGRNVEALRRALGLELHTVTIDRAAMAAVLRAYVLSGVANLDAPQDHVCAAAVLRFARGHGVRYVLSGNNLATEGASSPFSLQHAPMDAWHIRSIARRHGAGDALKALPLLSLREARWKFPSVTTVDALNLVPYQKREAVRALGAAYGWADPGGKHFENRFTRLFQSVYLPEKFGYDKRRCHLSCLVLNGEMARGEALAALKTPPCSAQQRREDERIVLAALGLSPADWARALAAPPTPNDAYPSQEGVVRLGRRLLGRRGSERVRRRKEM